MGVTGHRVTVSSVNPSLDTQVLLTYLSTSPVFTFVLTVAGRSSNPHRYRDKKKRESAGREFVSVSVSAGAKLVVPA